MILSDKTIYKYLESGELVIDPMEKGQVQPASVDIRLGSSFFEAGRKQF
ncbi:2'-deoxycytidine 5'-triphosphate deaminase domain-containing protein [Acetobacterium bakii]